MEIPIEGSCPCGSVRILIEHEPLFTHACHCLDCQQRSGSAFGMTTLILETDLRLAAGEPLARDPARNGTRQIFLCRECGSMVWAQSTEGEGVVIVPSGRLSYKTGIRPQAHIFVHRKQAWLSLDDSMPCFEGGYVRATTWPESSLTRLNQRQPTA